MRQAAKLGRVRATRRQRVSTGDEGLSDPPVIIERELSEGEREAEAVTCEPAVLLERLAARHTRRIEDYVRHSRGLTDPLDGHKLTDEELYQQASEYGKTVSEYRVEQARTAPLDKIEWRELAALATEDPAEALAKWEEVKQAARDELTSGFRSADMAGESIKPLDRARFIALHEQLEEGWQPRNGVEHSLVDMLAQTLSLFQYWTQIAHARAVGASSELYEEDRQYKGCWPRPRQDAADAIEQAQRLADGYHRQYMRTLRQMRDLRRYAPPVIVNNGGQVNVAANGGQQVNVA